MDLMDRRRLGLALPLLLTLLGAGCHLIFPFDVTAADGGSGGDLPAVADLAPTPELPLTLDSATNDAEPPVDLWPLESGGDDQAPPPHDLLPPTCSAQTLLSQKVSQVGWIIDGTANADNSNITFAGNQETSALFTPAKPIDIPTGCGIKAKISGSFSKGELIVMLYTIACLSVVTCGVGPKPDSCSLQPDTSGSGYSCVIPSSSVQKTYKTIRIQRPAGSLVGSALVSWFWLDAQ